MIVIRIEMWPLGDRAARYTLGTIHVINDGTGDVKRGNYYARFFGKKGPLRSRNVVVSGWPRLARPVFSLLKRVLEEARF